MKAKLILKAPTVEIKQVRKLKANQTFHYARSSTIISITKRQIKLNQI